MDDIKLSGRIIANSDDGAEASLIIPIGKYNIMVVSDDSCGEGKGRVVRSYLFVYSELPSNNLNEKVFGYKNVTADTETLFEAMQFCQRQLRKSV